MCTKTFKIIKASNPRRQETWSASPASERWQGKKLLKKLNKIDSQQHPWSMLIKKSIIITCRERQFKPIWMIVTCLPTNSLRVSSFLSKTKLKEPYFVIKCLKNLCYYLKSICYSEESWICVKGGGLQFVRKYENELLPEKYYDLRQKWSGGLRIMIWAIIDCNGPLDF